MKLLIITILALVAASSLVSAACHNATGSCTPDSFVCANEERIPHAKRCDGVEDCADGTDEYMCDAPTNFLELAPAKRNAITEVACIKCTCYKGTITVTSATATTAWWNAAKFAPRDLRMMTDSPLTPAFNRACHPTQTNQIQLNVYKKQNKGCRGWVCCLRQERCSGCTSGTPATHCY